MSDEARAARLGVSVPGRRTAVPGVGGAGGRVGPVEAAASVRRGAVADDLAPRTEARRGRTVLQRISTCWPPRWPPGHPRRCRMAAVWRSPRSPCRQRLRKPRGAPPMVLWALGPARLDDVARTAGAVVGTRAATAYGEHVAADFAAGLVERDVAVVSGGAFGIDGAAHRATLAADGLPWPCSPAASTSLIRLDIPRCCTGYRHSGLLVTEYPPGVRPARHRFLTRNRLVAALSAPPSSWRRACAVGRPILRPGRGRWAGWCAPSQGRSPRPPRPGATRCCAAAPSWSPAPTIRRARRPRRRTRAGRAAARIGARRPRRGRAAGLRRLARPRSPHRRPDRGRVRPAADAGARPAVDAGSVGFGGPPRRLLEAQPADVAGHGIGTARIVVRLANEQRPRIWRNSGRTSRAHLRSAAQ